MKHHVLHDIQISKGEAMVDCFKNELYRMELAGDPLLPHAVFKALHHLMLPKEAEDSSALTGEQAILLLFAWFNCSRCRRHDFCDGDRLKHLKWL